MSKSTSYKDCIEHIERLLACLSQYIKISNQQGTNDINVACENLVILLMNSVYGYKLENYNGKKHLSNAAGIDLIDTKNKICVQVTSNQTKTKFNHTIKACKKNLRLKGFKLMFFIISPKATKTLRSRKDNELGFDGENDVIDFQSLCDHMKSADNKFIIELDRQISCWLGGGYYNFDEFNNAIDAEDVYNNDIRVDGNYYSRKIRAFSDEDQSSFVELVVNPDKFKEYALKEYVTGKAKGFDGNYWLLIAAGQAGKSYEAKNLCALLAEDEEELFPVFYEAKRFNYKPKIEIPYYWQTNHIVLVIDGYDEIASEEKRGNFLMELENLQRKHPKLRIVLTSRRNFISGDKFLPNFQRLYLEDLSFDDVKEISYLSGIERPEIFLQLIEENSLYSLAYVPFYLNGLLDYYRKNGTIPRNRQAIYEFLIDKSFQADNERRPGSVVDLKLKGSLLLKRAALVMQFTEKKDLTIEDFSDMNFNDEDLKCCLSYTLFHKDDRGHYRFEKNAFQLYYVATFLSELDVNRILNLISFHKYGINRIKPEWLDAFELLLSVMPEGMEKHSLLDWTYENHTEALLNIDASCMDMSFCHKVFKKILLEYKEKRITCSPDCGWSFDRKLATLCLNKDSLDLFLLEYSNEEEIGPYLYLLSFIFWFINPTVIRKYGLQDAYKDAAYKHLEEFGNKDSNWYEASYIPFENELFANSDDITKLIEHTKSIDHIFLKKTIFRLIVTAKLYDEFVDFSIQNESAIHDFSRKADSTIVSVSRDNVIAALSNVAQYEGLKKVWQYYPTITNATYAYRDNDAIKILPNLLNNTERLVEKHSDLKCYVDNAWLAEYNKHHYFYNAEEINNVFNLFSSFMAAHCDIDEIKTIINQLRSTIIDNERLTLQSKLYVRLKPGDITSLSAEWGDDEYYRDIVLSLRPAPSKDLDEELEKLAKTKYAQFLATIPKYPDYEKIRFHDKEIAFDRKSFRQYITSVLDKYAITTRKELRIQLKNDEELELNEYLWQYLSPYRLKNTDGYDINAVKNSLKSSLQYALFVIHTFHDDDNLSDKQKKVLKESLETLISDKHLTSYYRSYKICTIILTKHGFDLDEESIMRLLPYAGLDNITSLNKAYPDFIAYAVDKCSLVSVKPKIIELLKQETRNLFPDTLDLLVQYASYYSIKEVYGDILRHINCSQYPTNLADLFYRNNERDGIVFFMSNYDCLPADVQLYAIPQIITDQRNLDWALNAIKRNRQSYKDEQKAKAIKWLVYLGDGQALQECLDAVKKDYKTLWETYDVPPFKYSDTKYLPQILELLQLTWDLPESFNTWYSRLRDTLRQMASQSVQQFTEVVCALEKLVESDAKYSTINYFIGELRCNQEPIVVGAKPMTVKQAMQFINEL